MATKSGLKTLKISRSQPCGWSAQTLGRTHAMTKGVPGAHGSGDTAQPRHRGPQGPSPLPSTFLGANGVWPLPRPGVNVLVLVELVSNTLGREQNQTPGV